MAITLRYEKSGRSRSVVYPVFGFSFGVVALLLIVKTPIDVYRESKQAKWPSVVATITQRTVRRTYSRGYQWHIETEVRYTVDGKELTSSIHSRVGSSGEERDMYRWASQHPPGTSLPIRFDPQHHNTVVLDAGNMPESGSQVPGDLKMLLIFSVLSITLITIGRVFQRRQLKPV
jgi:Protein of unknown function (DUF3592)